jgi:predicted glycogen debranching enzyme
MSTAEVTTGMLRAAETASLALPVRSPEPVSTLDAQLSQEWLVTNGLGGYASGTLAGVPTRRYHGLLVAALPAPLGRMLLLGPLSEVIRFGDSHLVQLGTLRRLGEPLEPVGLRYLESFKLEGGLPVWRYSFGGWKIEKRVLMGHLQNTVHLVYRVLEAGELPGPLRLEMHPTLAFRPHDAPVCTPLGLPFSVTASGTRYEIASSWPAVPPVRLSLVCDRPSFTMRGQSVDEVFYSVEERRGYEAVGPLWSPGYFAADLEPGESASLVASTESWELIAALSAAEALDSERARRERLIAAANPQARTGFAAELVLAADQFVVLPGRPDDLARARAEGDELRSVIAGYHWFTDWGRDTMISLEGLTLATGRGAEAGCVLRTFARHVRDGLIPNLFPEGDREGLYHTADATLWFFHALHRYRQATGDDETLRQLLPVLQSIVDHHLAGTRFGIGVDAADGLLKQGAPGYQLTWMDAKVDDWVVTPRRGKAVEINALWYNALCLLVDWIREFEGPAAAAPLREHAEQARASFNGRFWSPQHGYLFDVVDGEAGDDPACRPNQVLALSLEHPILDPLYWRPVIETVRERLWTPFGLRSLAPGEREYKPTYDGDLRSRDAAYHQGTVWTWLIGPFLDAWLRVYPHDTEQARTFLSSFVAQLGVNCMGTISEIFDAEPPWTSRGCVAQAWSVAEVLRAWLRCCSSGDLSSPPSNIVP